MKQAGRWADAGVALPGAHQPALLRCVVC